MEPFAALLYDVSQIWKVDLHPDRKQICRFNYNNELHVQLEFEEGRQRILVAAFLCEVPAGKYRELLFKACLRANFPYPRFGTLGYSERNNQLALFYYVYLSSSNGQKFAAFLESFIQNALIWKEAVEKNHPFPGGDSKSSSPFEKT